MTRKRWPLSTRKAVPVCGARRQSPGLLSAGSISCPLPLGVGSTAWSVRRHPVRHARVGDERRVPIRLDDATGILFRLGVLAEIGQDRVGLPFQFLLSLADDL